MAAERDATDRYIAAFLADRVGAEFEGRITGVTRFGLFVRLAETGADGLVPVSQPRRRVLHPRRPGPRPGRRAHRRALARWARSVTVRLTEATPITGRPAVRDAERAGGAATRRPRARA